MDVFIAFIHDLLLVFYCVFSAEEKMECKKCYSAVKVSVAGVLMKSSGVGG